jgi:hypothetical protein
VALKSWPRQVHGQIAAYSYDRSRVRAGRHCYEHLLARWTHNPPVVASSPTRPTDSRTPHVVHPPTWHNSQVGGDTRQAAYAGGCGRQRLDAAGYAEYVPNPSGVGYERRHGAVGAAGPQAEATRVQRAGEPGTARSVTSGARCQRRPGRRPRRLRIDPHGGPVMPAEGRRRASAAQPKRGTTTHAKLKVHLACLPLGLLNETCSEVPEPVELCRSQATWPHPARTRVIGIGSRSRTWWRARRRAERSS